METPAERPFISYELSQQPKLAPLAFYPSLIIIQARMGSTRLPGKVLRALPHGKPLLELLLERLRRIRSADAICVATTTKTEDDPIQKLCDTHSVHCYRGDSEDVLSRFYGASLGFDAEVVVRLTADCPFIDPQLINDALFCFRSHYDELDYLSNTLYRTYPRGMDIEIFRIEALRDAYYHAITPYEKEHVTPYMRRSPPFRLGNFYQTPNESAIRITVDTEDDFRFIEELWKRLYPEHQNFHLEDILRVVQKEPELLQINAHVEQKK